MLVFLSDGFRAATVVLLCVFGFTLILRENRGIKKNVFLLFLLSFLGYLLAYWRPLQSFPYLYAISFFLSIQLPLTFWLLSRAIFDDDFTWNWKYSFLLSIVPILHYLLYRFNETSAPAYSDNFRFLPYMVSVTFIVLVILEAVRNRGSDLVESRLRKRNIFVLFSSLLALASIYFFFTKDPLQLPPSFELIQNALSCLFILWIFSAQLSYRNLFSVPHIEKRIASEEKESEIRKRIIRKLLPAFEDEQIYTNEGLTISKLANHIGEKEYLLRRTINGEMGYQNFNDFLNHYRIQEACRLIDTSEQSEFTYQEIAFKMGYQSVATFNRAFKKVTGRTPSEYAELNNSHGN